MKAANMSETENLTDPFTSNGTWFLYMDNNIEKMGMGILKLV